MNEDPTDDGTTPPPDRDETFTPSGTAFTEFFRRKDRFDLSSVFFNSSHLLFSLSQGKESDAQSVLEAGIALGVRENAYTNESPQTLGQLRVDLAGALAARQNAYQQELQVQRDNDALCKVSRRFVTYCWSIVCCLLSW